MKKQTAFLICAAVACLAAPSGMTPDQKVAHAINRLTFGPRAGDLEQVRAMGLAQWIEQQLHPETVAENPELEKRLAPLDTLRMSTDEMLRHYPSRQTVKAIADGRAEPPQDPFARAVFEVAAKRIRKAAPDSKDQADDKLPAQLPADMPARPRERVAYLDALPADKLIAALEAIPQGQKMRLATLAEPELRRKIEVLTAPLQVIPRDLVSGKILRAVYSNRQLEEVLVDFWYNHFNVYLEKGADRELVTAYERDAIRPNVLGKFKDLLTATAQSPAMLFYLDNWQSSGPDAPGRGKQKRGLNENYGRELLELHTLGVDGGYTQQDVTEVARCFTGWTMRQPRQGDGFLFNPRMHDRGEKHVLGKTIEPGGVSEGLQVLDMVARHPSTAHFIATKLATRFVADDPPASIVAQMEKTFLATDGDLREVMRTMLNAPEFWDPARLNTKLKSPLEFLVSALRASGDEVRNPPSLNNVMTQMGEPLYRKAEPTGYSNRGADWLNSSSLLARMNFSTSLRHAEYGAPDFQRK